MDVTVRAVVGGEEPDRRLGHGVRAAQRSRRRPTAALYRTARFGAVLEVTGHGCTHLARQE